MSASISNHPKIHSLSDIEKVVETPEFRTKLIDGIKDGFVALEDGKFFAAPIQTLGLRPFPFVESDDYAAQTCVKSGYFKGAPYFVIKVASVSFKNEIRDEGSKIFFSHCAVIASTGYMFRAATLYRIVVLCKCIRRKLVD